MKQLTKKEKDLISFLNERVDYIKGPKSRLGFFRDVFCGCQLVEKEDVVSIKGNLNLKLSIAVMAEVEEYFKKVSIGWMRRRKASNFQSLMKHTKEGIILGCAVLLIQGMRSEKEVNKDIKQIFTDAERNSKD